MIEIMTDNGYGFMCQMMESIGRDGMIQMHNSRGAVNGSGGNTMMGQFQNIICLKIQCHT